MRGFVHRKWRNSVLNAEPYSSFHFTTSDHRVVSMRVLKNCYLEYIVLQMCNLTLMKKGKPDQWSFLNIIPVPKSGNLSDPNNYRGNQSHLHRSKQVDIEPSSHTSERTRTGSEKRRTTATQILALRRIIEKVTQFVSHTH